MFSKLPKRFVRKPAMKRGHRPHSLRQIRLDVPHHLPKRPKPVPSRWTGRLLGHFFLGLA
jgi:hypothetical protein